MSQRHFSLVNDLVAMIKILKKNEKKDKQEKMMMIKKKKMMKEEKLRSPITVSILFCNGRH